MSALRIALKKQNSAYNKLITKAANYINEREALFVMSGAGMSVDSGFPDLREDEAFY